MTEEKLAKIPPSLLDYSTRMRAEPRLGCAINRLLITHVLFQFHGSPCGIYAGQSDSGADYSSRTSVLPSQYHPSNVLYTFICQREDGKWAH